MLGLFSSLPPILRIVSLSTGGAFLLLSYLLIQYLLPFRSIPLRSGMSFLMGGILGNVTDRIIYGYVIDFMTLGNMEHMSPVFNFADAIQWVGYALIVYTLIKEGKNIWPDNDMRKSYWINTKYQLAYCFKLVLMVTGFSLIAVTYCYTYFRVMLSNVLGQSGDTLSQVALFSISFLSVTAFFMVMTFWVGLIMSHRSAGPIYAFEKFLEDLFDGKTRKLKLRGGDEALHLEKLADKLAEKFSKLKS